MDKMELKKPKAVDSKPEEEPKKVQNDSEEEEDGFDFGGLPKNVPFKRNIGCGG